MEQFDPNEEYEQEFERVCAELMQFLEEWTRNPNTLAPVAIVDVDGTALDDRLSKTTSSGYMPSHKPMEVVLQFLREKDIGIVFLTGRPSHLMHRTIRELKDAGYKYDHLYLYPIEKLKIHTQSSVASWKAETRTRLSTMFHIVLTVGDQEGDVVGPAVGEEQFLLPAPPQFETADCVIV